MAEVHTPIDELRDRLSGLLADWGAEFSVVLRELETKRARLEELEGREDDSSRRLDSLRQRVKGQEELIETLKSDAEEASRLRRELRNSEMELERVTSELESKRDLIKALRRDAEGADRMKSELAKKDQEIARLVAARDKAESEAEEFRAELEAARQRAREEDSSAELDALRSELEARKTLIESLRADAERVASLEASLDEKRAVIAKLEASINRHADTIAELRRPGRKAARDGESTTASVEVPTFTDTDLRALEALEANGEQAGPERTIAIDMRQSLLEARRTAARRQSKD